MAVAKIVVLYPCPDVSAFERAYVHDHAPMVSLEFQRADQFVASKIVRTPMGAHRPSSDRRTLFSVAGSTPNGAGSASAQQAVAHAVSIRAR